MQWVKFRLQRGVWKSSITSKINKIDQTKNWAKNNNAYATPNIWINTIWAEETESFKAYDAVVSSSWTIRIRKWNGSQRLY